MQHTQRVYQRIREEMDIASDNEIQSRTLLIDSS